MWRRHLQHPREIWGMHRRLQRCATTRVPRAGRISGWLDVQAGELSVRRESLSVAWYGTRGTYADERTGVPEGRALGSYR